jgi:hypothetical protein
MTINASQEKPLLGLIAMTGILALLVTCVIRTDVATGIQKSVMAHILARCNVTKAMEYARTLPVAACVMRACNALNPVRVLTGLVILEAQRIAQTQADHLGNARSGNAPKLMAARKCLTPLKMEPAVMTGIPALTTMSVMRGTARALQEIVLVPISARSTELAMRMEIASTRISTAHKMVLLMNARSGSAIQLLAANKWLIPVSMVRPVLMTGWPATKTSARMAFAPTLSTAPTPTSARSILLAMRLATALGNSTTAQQRRLQILLESATSGSATQALAAIWCTTTLPVALPTPQMAAMDSA